MMAAIMARRAGAGVLLLEKKNRLGKKLLATGNGKCNFTNYRQEPECYRCSQKEYPWQVISRFGCEESIAWFDEIGILSKQREGYVYPASGQAVSLLHALEWELKIRKVEVHTQEAVITVERQKKASEFVVTTEQGKYLARRVIVSTGGMAAPVHGSTGDGYELVRNLGHTVIPPAPALTSLVTAGSFMKEWSGVRVQGTVSLYNQDRRLLSRDTGEIQLVAYGISGIPVFQLSRFAARELLEKRSIVVCLDVMPEYSDKWIVQEILRRQERNGKQSVRDLLEGLLPDRLGKVYLQQLGVKNDTRAEELTPALREALAGLIKHMELPVKAVSDFEKAQVTCGGVATQEVDDTTMESKCCPGLFLTGELLDVDGMCGGYNLQWAWASGYIAGSSAGKGMGNRK